MAKEQRRKKKEAVATIETTIDPYTGEEKPVAEDADQFIEVVPEETDDRQGSNYLLNEESSMDSYAANADADAVAEQSAHYTEDKDIEEDFADRQNLAVGGRDVLLEELDEHNSLSPEISGGDLDASWQTANVAGEEALGGSAPTPDQDIVDNLGAAAGLTYKDDEPLNYDKVLDRDRNRWEMNPASALDDEELEEEDLDDLEEDEDLEDDLDELEDLDDDELDEDEEDEEDEDLDEPGHETEDEEELIDAETEDEEEGDR